MGNNGVTTLAAAALPPILVALGLMVVRAISNEAIAALIMWTLLSFPIGMVFGNCTLSED